MTPKQLEAFFAAVRAKQERKKEAVERKKQKQLDNLKKQQEKAKKRLENEEYTLNRTVRVYHNRYVDRSFADDEVYSTREELMEAEKRGEGSIRWDVFDKLVNETKKIWEGKDLQRLRGRLEKLNATRNGVSFIKRIELST